MGIRIGNTGKVGERESLLPEETKIENGTGDEHGGGENKTMGNRSHVRRLRKRDLC